MKQIRNHLIEAVCIGDLERVRYFINQFNRTYSNRSLINGYEFLLSSTELKHTEITKLLLNSNCQVNSDYDYKPAQTPLHFAAENGDLEIVELLLRRGAEINAKNKSGSTPLLCALMKGHEEIADLLLPRKAHLCGNNDGITPLQVAIEKGLSKLVVKLSNVAEAIPIFSPNTQDTELVSVTNKKYRATTLLSAAANGDLELVKLFIEQGADIGEKNSDGLTPIFYAVKNNHIETTEFLLNKGANDIGDENGITPLHIAADRGFITIAEILLKHGFSIDSGCYPDSKKEGFTPLHFAVESNQEEVVKLLLNHGANVNAVGECIEYEDDEPIRKKKNKTKGDITPLHIAAEKGLTDTIEQILKLGGNVNSKTRDGIVPLHFAVANRRKQAIELLLKFGANVHAQGKFHISQHPMNSNLKIRAFKDSKNDGITPLHIAAREGFLNIAKILLKHGANINSASEERFTPLHFAIANKKEDSAAMLFSHGAKVNVKARSLPIARPFESEQEKVNTKLRGEDLYGDEAWFYNIRMGGEFTPLQFAARYADVDIIKLLLNNNADVDFCSKYGKTPLCIALQCENIDAAKFLIDHGANIDAEVEYCYTILSYAVTRGYSSLTETILKQFRPDIHNKNNKESLKIAIKAREDEMENKKIVQCLLEYGFTISREDAEDSSLVYNVIRKGYAEILKELFQYGLDVRRKIKDSSPLHIAVENQHLEVAKCLLAYGADANATDDAGKTPIVYSIKNTDSNMTNLLISNGATIIDKSYDLLILAIQKDFIKMVEILLQNRIKIDATDKNGVTALHSTALDKTHKDNGPDFNLRAQIARLLLKYGANVNAKTKYDRVTTLHLACQYKLKNLVEVLVENNADVNCVIQRKVRSNDYCSYSYVGYSALDIVAKVGTADIVPILLKGGAKINWHGRRGYTPLHIAAKEGNGEVVLELLKHGAFINAKDQSGRTPLHYTFNDEVVMMNNFLIRIARRMAGRINERIPFRVTFNDKEGIMNILVTAGADINCCDNEGRTPVHLAAVHGNVKVLSAILKHGAFVDAKCKNGTTALLMCCEIKNNEHIKLLLEFGADVNIMNKENKTLIDLIELKPYDSDHSDYKYEDNFLPQYVNKFRAMRIIKMHLIKLKAANFYIKEQILCSIDYTVDEILKAYPAVCAEEISKLKREKLSSNVSLYDILKKNINLLTKYAGNEDVVKAFESIDYETKFPIYANMIGQKFRKGYRRRILLDRSHDFFDCYFKLPYGCVDEIKSYLSDEDLKTIMDLWKQLTTRSS